LCIPALIARKPPIPVTAIVGIGGAVFVVGTIACGRFVGKLFARRVIPPVLVDGIRPARALAAVTFEVMRVE
jgi:hypothetical protein